jgi:hypothetical protein
MRSSLAEVDDGPRSVSGPPGTGTGQNPQRQECADPMGQQRKASRHRSTKDRAAIESIAQRRPRQET